MVKPKEIQKIESNNIANIKWLEMYDKTPKEYVKTFNGRGNKTLAYVQTGYMVKRLNEVFNYLWDFEILSEKVERGHVMVKGKLTVHLSPELTLTKTQYGGATVKTLTNTPNSPVDLADDMKAAASDALKKCASLFGIASDIYWGGEVEKQEEAQPVHKPIPIYSSPRTVESTESSNRIDMPQLGKIKSLYIQKGLNSDAMHMVLMKKYGVESSKMLDKVQASDYIKYLLELEDKKDELDELNIDI